MDSSFLSQRASTLLEIALVMTVILGTLAMVVPGNLKRLENARVQKTVAEMHSIAQASIDYYVSQGACPVDISQLWPRYLPQAVNVNSFSSPYELNCSAQLVSVSSLVPSGLMPGDSEGPLLEVVSTTHGDLLTITQRVPYALIGRLIYDKKYLYGGS